MLYEIDNDVTKHDALRDIPRRALYYMWYRKRQAKVNEMIQLVSMKKKR